MKFGNKKLAWFAVSAIVALTAGCAQTRITRHAEHLLARCENEGAVKVVTELTRRNEQEDWIAFTEQVATGNTAAIKASACLEKGIAESGGASAWAFLHIGWLAALTQNPAAMLEIESRGASITRVCEADHFEPEVDFYVQYIKDTLAALEAVTEPHLQTGKQRCIDIMKTAYESPNIRKFIQGK